MSTGFVFCFCAPVDIVRVQRNVTHAKVRYNWYYSYSGVVGQEVITSRRCRIFHVWGLTMSPQGQDDHTWGGAVNLWKIHDLWRWPLFDSQDGNRRTDICDPYRGCFRRLFYLTIIIIYYINGSHPYKWYLTKLLS